MASPALPPLVQRFHIGVYLINPPTAFLLNLIWEQSFHFCQLQGPSSDGCVHIKGGMLVNSSTSSDPCFPSGSHRDHPVIISTISAQKKPLPGDTGVNRSQSQVLVQHYTCTVLLKALNFPALALTL